MGVFDKFINAIRINDYDDFDEDDKEFYDEENSAEDEAVEEKPKKGLFSRIVNRDKDDFDDEEESFESKPEQPRTVQQRPAAAPAKAPAQKPQRTYSPKVTPIKRKGGSSPMEVYVIKPTSMEDTREIADTLLSNCTVVLNLEGIDVELAQRVIDFTSGACYSIDGSLQKVSSYIFILTPSNVEISGDITDILNGTTGNAGF